MATPSTMIVRALQLIGEKPIGGTLSSDEQTAYLAALNSMMESWALSRLMAYQIQTETKALTTSDGQYTIGSGGDINTTRPIKIVDPCWIRDSNNIDYEVTLIDVQQYGEIAAKTIDGGIPQYLYYDAAYTTALATIYLYPEPAANLTLYFSSWKQLQTFAAISTTVALPPGYERAIIYNLAIELAGGLISVQPEVAKIAKESKALIKQVNAPLGVLRMDAAIAGPRRWDINSGD